MAPPFLLPLAQCTDPSLVGGKAAGLARLLAAGFPVPDGWCLTTRAYEHFMQGIGLVISERWHRAVMRTGDDRKQELQHCREMIRRVGLASLVAEVWETLHRQAGTEERRWALRSSATNEDMDRASAAGLYRSVLGAGQARLGEAITDIWASAWDERVVNYLLASGHADVAPAMAIVIQPLLDASVAGVATSIHPVTGRDSHVTINAVRGLGPPLVDGSVSPDQYVVETTAGQPSRVIRRAVGQQRERLAVTAGGLAMEPVPSGERDRPTLSDQQLCDVTALTKRIEQAFQRPMDVEWAIDRDRLWALQARPMTAVRATVDHLTNEDCEWSRANFKETMPDVPSPMGLSFLERFMEEYILSHYRRLGCRIPRGLSSVRLHAGRPYLNVTLFHVLVGQLGGDPRLNPEQMGGDPVRWAPSVQPLGWPALLRAGWLMVRELRRVLKSSAASFAEMKELGFRYSRERVRLLSLEDARDRLDELGRWLDSREVTFGIAAGAGQCLQTFNRMLPRWLGADWRRLLNESLQGQGTVISAQQILRIADLVELARQDTVVHDIFRNGWGGGGVRESLQGSAFLAAFDRYLTDYGHRAVGESDIMSARLADQPEVLLQVIKTQLDGARTTPDELTRRQRAARVQALATIRRRLGWRVDRWLVFQWWYRRLCRFFALREANRHHLMWYSLAARHLLLHVGELFAERGVFSLPEDIFFLRLQELEALDDASTEQWAAMIRTRRAEREQWSSKPAPDAMCGWEDVRELLPQQTSDRLLRGIPLSSGIVSGPVRFVRATGDWSHVRSGDIIVAEVIDPGMAPLFGIAGGLIVEMGGTLSHGAIIAREYGLPAIANVSRAMSLLSENDHVTMDAALGVVKRHEASSGP